MSKKIPIYAWYFPNWHPDSRNEKWHGKGWTEWELLKHATPRFKGHTIYQPLWGYEDESDPKVMAKKIDTALAYGVDGFLWDFYWFNDQVGEGERAGSFRLDALDKGFFGASNNQKMKIALMLCYENFGASHPAIYWSKFAPQQTASGMLSPQAFYNATQYMIKHYFWRENYIRIEGKLLFMFYETNNFITSMGGEDGAKLVLDDLRRRVREAGLGEMMIMCNPGSLLPFREGTREDADAYFEKVGFDAGMAYAWEARPIKADVWPNYPYKDFVDNNIARFEKKTSKLSYPMNINVSQGWDPSPRTVPSDKYEKIGYPFDYITSDKNPSDFERALRAARDFFLSEESTGNFISLSTWNEWTEGNFLEPSVQDGYAYLEAVKRVFVDE